jgi:xanthosine utilization system XapX-like protein
MQALRNRRPRWHAAMASLSYGVLLVLTLCWGTVVAEAHTGMRTPIEAPARFDAPSTDPARLAEARSTPPPPDPGKTLTTAPVPTTWTWVALCLWLLPAAVAAVLRQRWPRALVLTLVGLLGILACESAIHSVHHLKDPRHAEACPVFSASQHVTGLTASTATPELPPPSVASGRLATPSVQARSRALDGEQSRAPPRLA